MFGSTVGKHVFFLADMDSWGAMIFLLWSISSHGGGELGLLRPSAAVRSSAANAVEQTSGLNHPCMCGCALINSLAYCVTGDPFPSSSSVFIFIIIIIKRGPNSVAKSANFPQWMDTVFWATNFCVFVRRDRRAQTQKYTRQFLLVAQFFFSVKCFFLLTSYLYLFEKKTHSLRS